MLIQDTRTNRPQEKVAHDKFLKENTELYDDMMLSIRIKHPSESLLNLTGHYFLKDFFVKIAFQLAFLYNDKG